MNKIFAITCHKLTQPLIHTVEYLSSFNENIILIHVDKKVNLSDFLILKGPNVHLIPNRIEVTWGHVSQIISVLELMKFSLEFDYQFFFLLSGDDIPIKTNEDLNIFLENHFKYNFIHYQDGINQIKAEDRVKYNYPKFFYLRKRTFVVKAKKLFVYKTKKILYKNKKFSKKCYKIPKMYKGTNWFGLKKCTVQYIIKFLDVNIWYMDLFEKSFCGDEVFFHTIVKTNEDLILFDCPNYSNKALRYIDWHSGPEYPRILTESDRFKIKNSNYFFARKIDENASRDFMEYFLN